ncbi:MAG: TonB-dependent receptor [Bacteroidales bacterium]|nr:TonB-dependent receptor [Bacteroidales bacterium]
MFLSLLVAAAVAHAVPDTLQPVRVIADRGVIVSRADTVSIDHSLDVSSVLLAAPGVYAGDYGGAAGLKTVSLRGLGSAHTAIYIDGVRAGNVQSDQIDLGMPSLDAFSSVTVDYAQNSLSFNTARPNLEGKRIGVRVRMLAGSFGTYRPYARIDVPLGRQMSLSVNGGAIISQGNFPLADGSLRTNNDILQIQTGADLFGTVGGGKLHAKAYYNSADRGTPGSLSWPSSDRQKDRNAFAQAVYSKDFSRLYSLNLSAKGAYDKLLYLSEWGDSDYAQTEFQLNSSHQFRITDSFTASLAADFQWDGLASGLYNESRIGSVIALAAAYSTERFKAGIALEGDSVIDSDGGTWLNLSPSADLRFTVIPGLDLVAFGRRAFRAPTFNELYYPGYGNPGLRPEYAWMADAGIDFNRRLGSWRLQARIDGFYNNLTDKIISAPSEADPMVWLPYNVGKVDALGADALAAVTFASGEFEAGLTLRYGYQSAVDKTPDSYSFGQQLSYIAKHSASAAGKLAWKGWSLEPVWTLRAGRVDSAGEMPDWDTLDLSAGKEFRFGGRWILGLKVTGRNLLDKRYEIVSGYPMPGRSVIGGIELRF